MYLQTLKNKLHFYKIKFERNLMKKEYTLVYKQYFSNYIPLCTFKKAKQHLGYFDYPKGYNIIKIELEGDYLPEEIDCQDYTISTECITDATVEQRLGLKENNPAEWFKVMVWPELQNQYLETEYDEDYL